MSHLPKQLHQRLPLKSELGKTSGFLKDSRIFTVCEEASCPNRLFCFARKRATFLALGKYCSRNCLFCAVAHKKKLALPDPEEPAKIALCAQKLGLKHIVITMVTRDDLQDGGARHLVRIMQKSRQENPAATLEILTSDFQGNLRNLDLVLNEKPAIFNHNLETVARLTPKVRDKKASYQRSLKILAYARRKAHKTRIKSGFMVGLGESVKEIKQALEDLQSVGCDIVTIGQYLPPGRGYYPLKKYYDLKLFEEFSGFGKKLGIKTVLSNPLVRSSLNADQLV